MPDPKETRPIIIKKKVAHGGHHGGAWKVAYADFVTAMMSLFIVLWLMNTSQQVQKAIAGYFNDPKGSGSQTGSAAISSPSETVAIDRDNVEKLKQEIQKAILKQADLTKLSQQIEITVTGEGLRIDLLEGSGGTFFESGSPRLSDNGVQLLNLLAGQLRTLPNHLLIEGHTDAQPFSATNGYTNWELSSDRANSARRLLQVAGIREDQVSQVRGYADQQLRVPNNPLDPSNRRVSLIVQWLDANAAPASTGAGQPLASSPPPATAAIRATPPPAK